jgi:hypothetical protein
LKFSTNHKKYLPILLDVSAEKQHATFLSSVKNFKPSTLKHIKPAEKNILPNAQGFWIGFFVNV